MPTKIKEKPNLRTIDYNLSTAEIKRLLVLLNSRYPQRELRRLCQRKDDFNQIIIKDLLISCDVDNSVSMFKNSDDEVIPNNQAEINARSITAISFNPYGDYDENWSFSKKDLVDNEKEVLAPTEIKGLEPTRWMILKRILLNQAYANLKATKFNRLIQCDLVKQPSHTAKEITINSNNVSEYTTIQKAMKLSRIIFIAWGNAGTNKRGQLMAKLSAAGFNVDQFYQDLLERVNKGELYSFRISAVGQPVQPNDHSEREIHQVTQAELNLIFGK